MFTGCTGLVGATYRACINPVKDPYRFCTGFMRDACINRLLILYRTRTGILQDFLVCPYRSCTGPMCILNGFIRAPVQALLCLRACPYRSCTGCKGLPIQILYRPCLGMFTGKSLGRNGIELEMQMFPDDLPLANIDADGYCCHFMRSSVRPTIHGLGFVYCIQTAWKKWPTIWHADVSRWLTLSIHGCLWILLLVYLSVHLSVCSFTAFSGGCAFADKSLGTNGIKFDMLMYLLV